MDYEKAYNEAIKRAREIIQDYKKRNLVDILFYAKEDLESIFPELKESEDELTWLTKYIEEEAYSLSMDIRDNEDRIKLKKLKKALAWLEKQKVADEEIIFRPIVGTDIRIAAKQALEKIDIGKKVVLAFNGAYIPVNGKTVGEIDSEYDAWLEKQGEEKTVNYPIEGMFPYTDPADTLDGEIENIWNKLRNCDNTFTAAKSGFYEVIHHFANWLEKQVKQKSTDKPKFEIGDEIKTDNEDPLTITKIDEQGYWSGDLFICSFEDSAKWELVGKIIKPKFEVGDWITNGDYTWKIIEVKPLDYILQSQDGNIVDDTISHVDEQFHSFTIEDAKDGDVLADDDNNIFIFDGTVEEGKYPFAYCGLTAQGFDSYDIRLPFTHDNNIHPTTWEQRNLLFKKMKEEGYEWSEETHELKKISQRMVSAEAKEALYDKPTDEEMKELLRTEYEKGRADTIAKMKSSWSEEDELNLKQAIYVCHQNGYTAVENWLKSLKDRYTWKPSEEQLECLHDAINHYHTNGYPASKLNELYEQMSKIYKL